MIYVVHKIRLAGRASRFSAWFSADPFGPGASLASVIDAERIDARGVSYPATDAERRQLAHGPWRSYAAPVAIPTLEGGAS
jgi:hypothetical protein